MADDKSQDGESDKKQVKFSETSKETTYNKDQDETNEDEEVGQMRRSAHSRGSHRSINSRTSSGEYITGDHDIDLDPTTSAPDDTRNKELDPESTQMDNTADKTAETDEEKNKRVGKIKATNETNDTSNARVTNELEDDKSNVKDNKSVSSRNSKESLKLDNEISSDKTKQDKSQSSADEIRQDNKASNDTLVQDSSTDNTKQDTNGSTKDTKLDKPVVNGSPKQDNDSTKDTKLDKPVVNGSPKQDNDSTKDTKLDKPVVNGSPKQDNDSSKDTKLDKPVVNGSPKQDNDSTKDTKLDKTVNGNPKQDKKSTDKNVTKGKEVSDSESKEEDSTSETDDNAQEKSDTDSKKEVKYALPQAKSYSLNSRQRQSVSSYNSSKTSLQVTNNQNEPPPATPQDVDLTAGLDSERRDTGESTNNSENKTPKVDGQLIPNDSQATDDDKSIKDHKTSAEGSSESLRRKNSGSNDEVETQEDTSSLSEKDKEKEQESVKQHVRLDLSSLNGENKRKSSAKSNDKSDSHIKTDFRRRRPMQTTATPVTVPAAKTSTDATSSSRNPATRSAGNTGRMTPRESAARDQAEKQRKAKSAGPGGRGTETSRSATSRASSRSSRPSSRPRSCGTVSERGRMKEFFQSELKRLKSSLTNEAKKFKKPKPRDHYPYVYTSLVPYCSTHEANFLINMPEYGYREKQAGDGSKSPDKKEVAEETEEDKELMFTTRSTAIRLCDPWDSLNMDRNVLPKLETAELRQKRMDQLRSNPKPKSPRTKRPEAKQGSTRLPKFPVIQVPNQELTTKELYYGDIPMIRDELVKNYSLNGDERKKSDYTRTKQDFFRMELDRINDYHKNSRPNMRAAYYAYLQNTPGSRKALTDCMKEIKQKKEPQTPQAVA